MRPEGCVWNKLERGNVHFLNLKNNSSNLQMFSSRFSCLLYFTWTTKLSFLTFQDHCVGQLSQFLRCFKLIYFFMEIQLSPNLMGYTNKKIPNKEKPLNCEHLIHQSIVIKLHTSRMWERCTFFFLIDYNQFFQVWQWVKRLIIFYPTQVRSLNHDFVRNWMTWPLLTIGLSMKPWCIWEICRICKLVKAVNVWVRTP